MSLSMLCELKMHNFMVKRRYYMAIFFCRSIRNMVHSDWLIKEFREVCMNPVQTSLEMHYNETLKTITKTQIQPCNKLLIKLTCLVCTGKLLKLLFLTNLAAVQLGLDKKACAIPLWTTEYNYQNNYIRLAF